MSFRSGLVGLLLLALSASPAVAVETLLIDDFEQGLSSEWETREFKGRTDYRVVDDSGGKVLLAESRASASGLIYSREFDPHQWPIISWRWKIDHILAKGDARIKSGDDYAARIYVIFPHWFFPKTKSINYIWANRLRVGALVPNPFTGNAMMLAVESGPERTGLWVTERRNIADDYRRAFSAQVPEKAVIAIMSDSDNTGSATTAWFDDIMLQKAP